MQRNNAATEAAEAAAPEATEAATAAPRGWKPGLFFKSRSRRIGERRT